MYVYVHSIAGISEGVLCLVEVTYVNTYYVYMYICIHTYMYVCVLHCTCQSESSADKC